MTVLYDPANPDAAEIDSFSSRWLLVIILSAIGIPFTAVGGGMLGYWIYRRRLDQWLKAHGTTIQAELTGSGFDTNVTVDGRNPYCLTAEWLQPGTSERQSFQSQDIWFDPAPYLVDMKTVNVWIDPAKPANYLIDTSFLPGLAEPHIWHVRRKPPAR